MKIVQLTGSLSKLGGGVSEIMRSLAKEMHELGHEVEAIGLIDQHFAEDRHLWAPINPRAFAGIAPAIPYAPQIPRFLKTANPDVVHSHGIWNYASYAAYRWRRSSKGIHVITPQGMLEPWARSHRAFKKSVAWRLFEQNHFGTASCINVNSEQEMENLRELGIQGPVCVVPNGVSIPAIAPPGEGEARAIWADAWPEDRKVLLYLSRVHPKKGLIPLLRAWSKAQSLSRSHGWSLAIVGWDEDGFGKEINREIRNLDIQDSVVWFGPAFGECKSTAFRQATAYILPSFSEGFPMTVLEAWSYGLPVLMTPECNMTFGYEVGAATKILPTENSIFEALLNLFKADQFMLKAQGEIGRKMVEDSFSWRQASIDLLRVYAWCLGKDDKPDFVHE